MKYLVRITPLEAYTFGTDQGFQYRGQQKTGKESYLVTSNRVPPLTTIFGTLRYLVLKQNGALRTSFRYSPEEKEYMNKLIGPKSFEFGAEICEFGKLKKVSPLMLLHGDEVLIPNPFCNKSQDGYDPMKLSGPFTTSRGEMYLPDEEEYDPKDGHGYGFLNLNTMKVVSEDALFLSKFDVGIKIAENVRDNDEGFFKREVIRMAKDYCFAVCVETEDDKIHLPADTICHMGMKNSSFRVTSTLLEVEDEKFSDFETYVEKRFLDYTKKQGLEDSWYMALSDIYVEKPLDVTSFAIVEERCIRNLETKIEADNYHNKRRKTEKRIHLIQAGSVFTELPDLGEHKNCKMIGYNSVVRLGGN